MKNVTPLVFLIAIVLGNSTTAQNTFQKSIGAVGDQIVHGLQITSDSGFIIAGTSSGLNNQSEDIFLIRTDGNGDTLWVKRFGGTGTDEGNSVIQSSDGGFVIVGNTNSFGAGSFDVFIIKTDGNGNLLWAKTVGAGANDIGTSIEETAGGNYLIAGSFEDSINNNYAYLIKMSSDGNLLWTKTYGGGYVFVVSSMCKTNDGNYVLVGYGDTHLEDGIDFCEMKVDSNGSVLWSKAIGSENRDYVFFVGATSDGGSVIGLHDETISFGPYDILVIKTDENGDTLWTKIYGGTDFDGVYSIRELPDGGYAIAGGSFSFEVGNVPDVYMIRIGNSGDVIWSKVYGEDIAPEYGQAMQLFEGGYCIAGYRYDLGNAANELYLIKTDSAGNSDCNEKDVTTLVTHRALVVVNVPVTVGSGGTVTAPTVSVESGGTEKDLCNTGINGTTITNEELSIFPNPAKDKLFINCKSQSQKGMVSIYDVIGKRVLYEEFDLTPATEINLQNFLSGIYCIEVRDGNQVYKSEFVVSRE